MKKPHLVPNAKRVALRAWSLWLNRAAIVVVLSAELVFYITGAGFSPYTVMYVWLALAIGVEVVRYVRQSDISDYFEASPLVTILAVFLAMGWLPDAEPRPDTATEPAPGYTQADFLAVAVPLIAKWEGLRTEAYRDIVGVWTVCYGETKGVRPGDLYSKAECDAMLAREVLAYRDGWHSYLDPETRKERLISRQW